MVYYSNPQPFQLYFLQRYLQNEGKFIGNVGTRDEVDESVGMKVIVPLIVVRLIIDEIELF